MKKSSKFLALLLGGTLSVAGAFTAFTACDLFGGEAEAASYVSLDINPSLELVLDKKDKVISVTAENEDAEVLLYEETDLTGKDIDKVIDRLTALAEELGYLSEDNKVIDMTVSSALGDERVKKLEGKIQAKCKVVSEKFGFSIEVSKEGAYSLVRELNKLKEAYPDNEAIQNLDVAAYKLILAAQKGDSTLTIEAAVQLDDEALMALVAQAKEKIKKVATEAYEEAAKQAEIVYEKAKAIALNGVYSAYYATHAQNHPINYGLIYQMYATMADGLYLAADAAELVAKAKNAVLNEQQVAAVVAALKLDETEAEKLKNDEGNVTVESVLAYADVKFKNSPAGAELEQMKKDLNAALNATESAIKQKMHEVGAEHRNEVQSIVAQVEGIKAQLDKYAQALPANVKAYIDDFAALLDEVAALRDNVTVESLREVAAKFAAKEVEIEMLIKSDLSEAELAEVEVLRNTVEAGLTAAKGAFNDALEQARTKAHENISRIRREREANHAHRG